MCCRGGTVNTDVFSDIYQAAFASEPLRLKTLLKNANVDINCRDHHGYTALHYAAQNGNTEALIFLLRNKADPTILTEPQKLSVLHLACFHHHIECLNELLQTPARNYISHRETEFNLTCSEMASMRGFQDILDILATVEAPLAGGDEIN